MSHIAEHVKQVGDIVAATTMVGSLVKWLPPVAAIFTIIWTALRIYEWFEGRLRKKYVCEECKKRGNR